MFAWHVMRLWAALNMDSNCRRIGIFTMLGPQSMNQVSLFM